MKCISVVLFVLASVGSIVVAETTVSPKESLLNTYYFDVFHINWQFKVLPNVIPAMFRRMSLHLRL